MVWNEVIAMFEYYKNWMEFWFFVLMLLGIVIALVAPSAVISYVIAFISGIFGGRFVYERKHKVQFPYLIIMLGFFIGFLLGVYYGKKLVVIAAFILGAVFSYKFYDKKILRDTRF